MTEAEFDQVSEALKAQLLDPNVIHLNMLRGGIAKLSRGQILHVYPELRDEIERLRSALSDAIKFYDGLDREHDEGEAELLDRMSAALGRANT